MQLPLKLLAPTVVLPSFHRAGRTRLAETGDRIPLPAIQLCRIQPLFATPGTARRLIHRRCDDHRLQPRRCRPAWAASARSIGQGVRPPTLQRRHAYPDFTRNQLDRRALRRQQPRHYPILVRLSVSSHCLLSAPPKVPFLCRRQLLCWGGRPHGIECQTWVVIQPRPEPSMTQYKRLGIDTSKAVFTLHGIDQQDRPVLRINLRRAQMLPFFKKLSPTKIAMEACGGAHHWARELIALGHEVNLVPPQYVKPYVKRSKSDRNDAEAI